MFCAKGVECMVDLGGSECPGFCQMGLSVGEPECGEASAAFYECLIGLSCAEFAAAISSEWFEGCIDELKAQVGACGGRGCEELFGTNEEGTECLYAEICPEGTKEMDCDATTCTCAVDGMPIGMCAADGVCMDFLTISDKAAECCGF